MHSAFKHRPPKKPTQPPRAAPQPPKAKPLKKKTSRPSNKTRSTNAKRTSAAAKVWLRDIVGDEKFARDVQAALGEETTQKLLRKIKKQKEPEGTPVYIVTPTYRRPEQQAELTRLAQTLMHVSNMFWLLVEDSREKTPLVTNLLKRWDMRTIHLNTEYKPPPDQQHGNPRGANCRNEALKWIRQNANDGVIYFADDDNTYDIELFSEVRNTSRRFTGGGLCDKKSPLGWDYLAMPASNRLTQMIRSTRKVSMFPVGLVTQIGLSTPIVKDGKFVGFCDGWMGNRKFPVDMAGFAVSVDFLKKVYFKIASSSLTRRIVVSGDNTRPMFCRPDAQMPYREGEQEDRFLRSLAPFEPHEIELKASNCTKLLVWHTQTVDYRHLKPPNIVEKYPGSNLVTLMETIVYPR